VNTETEQYTYSNKNIRKIYSKYALEKVSRYTNALSLTFTFIGPASRARLIAEERFTNLLHKVSAKVNRNRYKRHKELVSCIAVQEFDDATRPNIHAIFDVPKKMTQREFYSLLKPIAEKLFDVRQSYISKTQLRKKPKIHISQFNNADRAVNYLMKKETKDLKNTNFAEFVIA